jgi:MoaA/NifB/PqqE/SkfB family radical SAM enzyme
LNTKLRRFYPLAMVNITNRCTLKCKHCFVFREGNPNIPTKKNEMLAETMIKEIKKYKRRHGIYSMVWMGGEPLLRKDVLRMGVKIFPRNVVTTNGTIPLINLGSKTKWVISLDGPELINDEIRGKGCFKRVIKNLNNLSDDFTGDLQCQCVVTKKNENGFEELIDILMKDTPVRGIILSFYVPRKSDTSEFAWATLKERDFAVKKAYTLKEKYPNFILNKKLAFELMLSQNSLEITNNCPMKKYLLPLYLGDKGFEIPFCCHGNDVNCDLCGSFGVFHLGALIKMNPLFNFDNVSKLDNI